MTSDNDHQSDYLDQQMRHIPEPGTPVRMLQGLSSSSKQVQLDSSAASRAGCGRYGCVLAVIAGVLLLILACGGSVLFVTSVLIEETWFVPGDAGRYDPVAGLDAVRQHAGEGAQLLSISAWYVRSDGTLDLSASYNPRVVYNFFRVVPRPADAPPIGAGGTTGLWYEPVAVNVYRPWTMWNVRSSNNSYQYLNLGMDRESGSVTSSAPGSLAPEPQCSFAGLWAVALREDAPPDAVAIIEYDAGGYDFRIQDTNYRYSFDLDCNLLG